MTVAWVFPGQGSQKIGMAKQIQDLPSAKARFSYASELFKRNLFEICESNPDPKDILNDLNNINDNFFSVIIIGSGPAGITTALKLEEQISTAGLVTEDYKEVIKANKDKRDPTFTHPQEMGKIIHMINKKQDKPL